MSLTIGPELVGATAGPLVQEIDARWLMAYAAGLGATDPALLDTTRPEGLLAHPLFPVCYEWPLSVELRATRFTREVAVRSVHATHDLTLHRLPRAGDRLRTTARVVAVERRTPGAYVLTRHETVDAAGAPVSTTLYGSLHLGVGGGTEPAPDRAAPGVPATHASEAAPAAARSERVAVLANLAHVYTECARIWNPIHTDRAVALATGLPDIILHGTATLALAVTRVLAGAGRSPADVRRITCRFGGMVRLPSAVDVRTLGAGATDDPLAFEVIGADGRPAVRDGRIWLA